MRWKDFRVGAKLTVETDPHSRAFGQWYYSDARTQAASAEKVSSSMAEMASNSRQSADNARQTEKIPGSGYYRQNASASADPGPITAEEERTNPYGDRHCGRHGR